MMPLVQHSIIVQYLVWQFFGVPQQILRAWWDLLRYNMNYFSIPELLKTFFSYWRRYHDLYGKFDPWKYFEAFVFNTMSRVIGAILRTALILIGLAIEVLILVGGILVFVVWLTLPFLIIFGFFFGLILLIPLT